MQKIKVSQTGVTIDLRRQELTVFLDENGDVLEIQITPKNPRSPGGAWECIIHPKPVIVKQHEQLPPVTDADSGLVMPAGTGGLGGGWQVGSVSIQNRGKKKGQ